jgi:NAD(P)-dependent dehydrogenase (short-subunit alcohol dehydrogenase family)
VARIALITGGMGGIGTAICSALASSGAQVVSFRPEADDQPVSVMTGAASHPYWRVHDQLKRRIVVRLEARVIEVQQAAHRMMKCLAARLR